MRKENRNKKIKQRKIDKQRKTKIAVNTNREINRSKRDMDHSYEKKDLKIKQKEKRNKRIENVTNKKKIRK